MGLKGSFLCCKIFGSHMAQQKAGVIVNIASDLSVISPDQRLYRQTGLKENKAACKTNHLFRHQDRLVGIELFGNLLAHRNVRVNALSPGGIYTGGAKGIC